MHQNHLRAVKAQLLGPTLSIPDSGAPGGGRASAFPVNLPRHPAGLGITPGRTTGLSHLELRVWGYSMEPKGFGRGLFAR